MNIYISVRVRVRVPTKRGITTKTLPKNKKKPVVHEGDGNTNCICCPWNGLQKSGKGTVGMGNRRKNRDHPDTSKRKVKYLDLARELKKRWIMKVTVIPLVIDAHATVNKKLVQGLNDLEIREQVDLPIVEVGQNTEKSPGDLRRFADTQTPFKDHQLNMEWKTLKWIIISKRELTTFNKIANVDYVVTETKRSIT